MTFRQPILKRRGKEIRGEAVTIDKADLHLAELLTCLTLKMNDYSILW